MLISFPPKYSISYVMGYLKGKSSLMIFDRHANLKYKYGNRHFWARGYFVDLVNLAQVAGIAQEIVKVGPHSLPVSRTKRRAFLDAMSDYIYSASAV